MYTVKHQMQACANIDQVLQNVSDCSTLTSCLPFLIEQSGTW